MNSLRRVMLSFVLTLACISTNTLAIESANYLNYSTKYKSKRMIKTYNRISREKPKAFEESPLEALISKAHKEISPEERKHAYNRGYDEGYDQGYWKGYKEGKKEWNKTAFMLGCCLWIPGIFIAHILGL